MTTTFDLEGKRKAWDVVITSPDSDSISIPAGFTVEEGREPELWVDVVGHRQIEWRQQKYWVMAIEKS